MRRLAQQQRQVAGQEGIVFEKTQKSEVGREAQNQQRFSPGTGRDLLQPEGGGVVDGRQSQQQRDELGVPARVEEVAGREQDISAQTDRKSTRLNSSHAN